MPEACLLIGEMKAQMAAMRRNCNRNLEGCPQWSHSGAQLELPLPDERKANPMCDYTKLCPYVQWIGYRI